jgi:hypothetical protein
LQAVSFAGSTLQAEAQALGLAAQIGKSLRVQEPNFLTDSQIIADVLTRSNLTKYPGHWRIRTNLCQFLHHLQGIQARVYKIKRENNIVAHRNAQEAINSHSTRACTFNCTGIRHPSELCPVKAVISNLNVQSSTLISVTCQWTKWTILWAAKKKKDWFGSWSLCMHIVFFKFAERIVSSHSHTIWLNSPRCVAAFNTATIAFPQLQQWNASTSAAPLPRYSPLLILISH